MVRLEKFEITFDNVDYAYFAGQEISGKVVIETSEPEKVNEILLELKGRANTYWTKHSVLESCEEKFFHADILERILPKGRHEIPFSYSLPKTLPSSFEGEYGFIRYTCKATCERSWDVDLVAKQAFSVIGIEDINANVEVLQPMKATECNSSIRFLCCKQGSVSATLSIDRTGFTPGESVHVELLVNNESHRTLRYSCVKLKQHVEYRAKTFAGSEELKTVSKTIVKIDLGEIAARSTLERTCRVGVPSIPPRLNTCKIMQISYTVQCEVDGGVTATIPVQIGTIPFLSNTFDRKNVKNNGGDGGTLKVNDNNDMSIVRVRVTNEQGETVDKCNESNDIDEDIDLLNDEEVLRAKKKRVRMPSSILSELYPRLPNPYFRESHFGPVDILEDNENVQYGQKKFAPKYPFYNEE